MDILIRDIKPSIVKMIDEKATSHTLSRNEYLKRCFEKMVTVDGFYEERNEYVSLVKAMESIIRHNNTLLSHYKNSMERIEKIMIDMDRENKHREE